MNPIKYDPQYSQLLLAHLQRGLTFPAFGGVVGASRDTLLAWCREHPEFAEARQIGQLKCQLRWELIQIEYQEDPTLHPKFNASLWRWCMERLFAQWGKDCEHYQQQEEELAQPAGTSHDSHSKPEEPFMILPGGKAIYIDRR
jgi:hypothetical protein